MKKRDYIIIGGLLVVVGIFYIWVIYFGVLIGSIVYVY